LIRHAFYFTADWCGPCKKIRPIVEEINRDSATKFTIIDVDENMSLCQVYSVTSVPTFIFIEDAKEIKRMSGAKTKQELEDFLNG
jgi:thioredoxin 1